MSETLAVVTLKKASGIPQDAVQNTFAFESLLPQTDPLFDAIAAALQHFYDENESTQTQPISHYLAKTFLRASDAGQIAFYNLSGHLNGSPHGSPVAFRDLTLSNAGVGDDLPQEVCSCLSFHSAYGSDVEFGSGTRPRARDRGRIYIGPLNTDCLQFQPGNGEPIVDDNFTADCVDAAAGLRDTVDIGWSVWSRSKSSLEPVVGGWMDNAFDTQRRRGIKASARTGF